MKKNLNPRVQGKVWFRYPNKGMPIDINNRDYYRTSIDPCNLYTKKQLIEKGIPLQTIIKKYDRRDVR